MKKFFFKSKKKGTQPSVSTSLQDLSHNNVPSPESNLQVPKRSDSRASSVSLNAISNIYAYPSIKEKNLKDIFKAVWTEDFVKTRNFIDKSKGKFRNIQDSGQRTPLHLACVKGNESIVQLLLCRSKDFQVNVNIQDADGATPLIKAFQNEKSRIVEMLLSYNPSLEVKDKEGFACIHYAARRRWKQGVKLLLDKGADVDIVDTEGNTALHIASGNNDKATCSLLISQGATVDARNNAQKTPLIVAAENSSEEAVHCLVDGGHADLTLKDAEGWSAYDRAQILGFSSIQKYLRDKQRELQGRTASSGYADEEDEGDGEGAVSPVQVLRASDTFDTNENRDHVSGKEGNLAEGLADEKDNVVELRGNLESESPTKSIGGAGTQGSWDASDSESLPVVKPSPVRKSPGQETQTEKDRETNQRASNEKQMSDRFGSFDDDDESLSLNFDTNKKMKSKPLLARSEKASEEEELGLHKVSGTDAGNEINASPVKPPTTVKNAIGRKLSDLIDDESSMEGDKEAVACRQASRQANFDSHSENDNVDETAAAVPSQPVSSQSTRSISFLLPGASSLPEPRSNVTVTATYERLSQHVILNDVESYTKLGSSELEKGNVESALAAYTTAFNRSTMLDDKQILKVCCLNLGALYVSLNKPKKGLHFLLQTNTLSGANTEFEFDLNFNFGLVYESLSHSHAAIHHFKIALKFLERQGDSEGLNYAEICLKLSNLFTSVGLEDVAIKYCRKACAIYERKESTSKAVASHLGLANLLLKKNLNNEVLLSLDTCYQLIQHQKEPLNPNDLFLKLLALSEKYEVVNDTATSIDCAEFALKVIDSSLRNPSLSIPAYQSLVEFRGQFFVQLAKGHLKASYQKALSDYEVAVELFDQAGAKLRTAECYLEMAKIYDETAELNKCFSCLCKTLSITQGTYSETEQKCLELLSVAYQRSGSHERAASALASCLSVAVRRQSTAGLKEDLTPLVNKLKEALREMGTLDFIERSPIRSRANSHNLRRNEVDKNNNRLNSEATQNNIKGHASDSSSKGDKAYNKPESLTDSTLLMSPASSSGETVASSRATPTKKTPKSAHRGQRLSIVPEDNTGTHPVVHGRRKKSVSSEREKTRGVSPLTSSDENENARRISSNGTLPMGLFTDSLNGAFNRRQHQPKTKYSSSSKDSSASDSGSSTPRPTQRSDMLKKYEQQLALLQENEDRNLATSSSSDGTAAASDDNRFEATSKKDQVDGRNVKVRRNVSATRMLNRRTQQSAGLADVVDGHQSRVSSGSSSRPSSMITTRKPAENSIREHSQTGSSTLPQVSLAAGTSSQGSSQSGTLMTGSLGVRDTRKIPESVELSGSMQHSMMAGTLGRRSTKLDFRHDGEKAKIAGISSTRGAASSRACSIM